ncbi:hypothetical protein [Actinomadura sp. 9N407]|uniref:hypothetical protein n=1 Tax=Actinomadura sp. 9N407 TaxID=3375154 RepID=UPI00378CC5EE
MSYGATVVREIGKASTVVRQWAAARVRPGAAMAQLERRPCEYAAYPELVVLFVAGIPPEAKRVFEVFAEEARTWRTLAEIDAERERMWSGHGRTQDAAVCAGRAQAYRQAADNIEEVLMDSLELWEQYERQVIEGDP